jgi:hypothetical protein
LARAESKIIVRLDCLLWNGSHLNNLRFNAHSAHHKEITHFIDNSSATSTRNQPPTSSLRFASPRITSNLALQQSVDIIEAVLLLCLLFETHHCHLMQQLTLFDNDRDLRTIIPCKMHPVWLFRHHMEQSF